MPRPTDVAGDLDELAHRLDGETIAFSLCADRTWSAMSYSGEYSAHGDTFAEVLDGLLEQLPVFAHPFFWSPMRRPCRSGDGSAA
jgi:hypothetical protein